MIIKNLSMMCIKVEPKQNKEGKDYLMITLADTGTGDIFEILEKDMTMLSRVKMFNQYKVNLNLKSSKYGLSLSIDNIEG